MKTKTNEIRSSDEDEPHQRSQIEVKSGYDSFLSFQKDFSISDKVLEYYQRDNHFVFLKKIKTRVVHEIEDCEMLWNLFSPKQTIFDTWEFRYSFWTGYQYKPHFIVVNSNGEDVAVLPLWYEGDKGKYFWFGSWWQEENSFFVKDSIYIPLLLSLCPKPAHLNAITLKAIVESKKLFDFKVDEPKYILELKNMNSSDDFLQRLSSKKRYNIRRDRRMIGNLGPEVIFDRFEDFESLVDLSKKRFATKGEETDWVDPRRVETFREVIRQGQKEKSYRVRMLTILIEGKIAAVDLITIYKGVYSPLKCGYDVESFPGIGNYVNLLEIEDAISLGMKTMDFLEVNYGWKDRWFEAVPLFAYDNCDEKK